MAAGDNVMTGIRATARMAGQSGGPHVRNNGGMDDGGAGEV